MHRLPLLAHPHAYSIRPLRPRHHLAGDVLTSVSFSGAWIAVSHWVSVRLRLGRLVPSRVSSPGAEGAEGLEDLLLGGRNGQVARSALNG